VSRDQFGSKFLTEMTAPTQHIKVPQWIHAGRCVVRVEVDALVLSDCPDPSLTPETVRWLEELQKLADSGRVDELARFGTVYVRRSA
jgi:hypothetical protein